MKKWEKKKRPQEPTISNINKGAISVVSMLTSLVAENDQRIKKKKKVKTKKKKDYKKKYFGSNCYNCSKKWHRVEDFYIKTWQKKKWKTRNAVDDRDDNLALCLLTSENKKQKGVLCTIDWKTFHTFTIGDSSMLCLVTKKYTGNFDITKINKSVQGHSGSMPATKKRKLCINVCQVDSTEWVHTQWPMKFCPKAGANGTWHWFLQELLANS